MISECHLEAVDSLFGFFDHAVEQDLDGDHVMNEAHAHAGAEYRAVHIAVEECKTGLLAGDDGHLLLEDFHGSLAGGQSAVLDLVCQQGGVVLRYAHHAADALLAEHGVLLGVVDDPLAVILGNGALVNADEARAHCDAGRAQSKGRSQSVSVGNAARGDDGYLHIGGALKSAGVPDFKKTDRALVAWYEATLKKLGVEVRLNTRADRALLDSLEPDTVFVAEGSTPKKLPLPVAEGANVVSALDVLDGKAQADGRVVVIGAGLVACELALHLAQHGRDVTILARRTLLKSSKLPAMNEFMLRDLLIFNKVHIVEKAALESVDARGVYYQLDGRPMLAEADTVVAAVGMQSNRKLFDEIRNCYENVLALGDGRQVRNISGAIWDGYEAARSL